MKNILLFALVGMACLGLSCNKDAVSASHHFYKVYENTMSYGNIYPVAVAPVGSGYVIAAATSDYKYEGHWQTPPYFLRTDEMGKLIDDWKVQDITNFIGFYPWQIITHPKTNAFAVGVGLRKLMAGDMLSAHIQWISNEGTADTCGWNSFPVSNCPKWKIPDNQTWIQFGYPANSQPPALAFLQEDYKTTIVSSRQGSGGIIVSLQTFLENGQEIYTRTLSDAPFPTPGMFTNQDNWNITDGVDEVFCLRRDVNENLYLSSTLKYANTVGGYEYRQVIMKILPSFNSTPEGGDVAYITNLERGNAKDYIYGFEFDQDTTTNPLMLYTEKQKVYLGRGDTYFGNSVLYNFPDIDGRKRMQLIATADKSAYYIIGGELSGGIVVYKFNRGEYDQPAFKRVHGYGIGMQFGSATLLPDGDLLITGTNTFSGVNTKPFLMRISGEDGNL